ncbi:hypothetical protein GCM10023319_12660 [Nocardia iowensis]
MINRLGKALVCAAMAASVIGFAAPSQAAPTVETVAAPAGWWRTTCEYGRACIRGAEGPHRGQWYNFDGCGSHGLNGHFDWAIAHGNELRVDYVNGRFDHTYPWTNRGLDSGTLISNAHVFC